MKRPAPFSGKRTFIQNGPGRHVHAALGQRGGLAAICSWLRICSRKRPPRERREAAWRAAPASLLAFSEVPGGLDRCGFAFPLPLADLESPDGEVRVHHVRRSLDVAEIGLDRYHVP